MHNNAINADSEKRRAFVARFFTAGYGERWASNDWKSADGYAFTG